MDTVCASGAAASSDTGDAVRRAVGLARDGLGAAGASMGIVFASARHPLEEVLEAASHIVPVPWIGASTAGETTNDGLTRGGVSVMLFSWGDASHRLSDALPLEGDLTELAGALCAGYEPLADSALIRSWEHAVTIVFGDGLSPRFERVVTEIRRATQMRHTVVGGGAGDDDRLERTFVGSNGRALEGGAVALHVVSKRPWGVGIGQGVRPCSPRMTVTRADGHLVHELDGRPALDVYRQHTNARAEDVSADKWAAFLLRNELGIYFFDDIVRVRAGLGIQGDSIAFAGEVPEGSVVAIVRGEPEELIEAARQAAEDAKAEVEGQIAGVLLISCVTRRLVLGDRYPEELRAVSDTFGRDVPLAGFLSYGEVARVRGKFDGYHNHTVVVVAIPA